MPGLQSARCCRSQLSSSLLRSSSLTTLGVLIILLLASPGAAQEQRSVRARLNAQVFRTDIQPQWLPDGKGFWYRVRVGQGRHEFVMIDARTGERVAGATPEALNLTDAPDLIEGRTSKLPAPRGMRSESNGDNCEVTFVNELDHPVQLIWINTDGTRVPYGTIEPGRSHLQTTYVGHQWLIVGEGNRPIARVVSNQMPNRIIIDGPQSNRPGERSGSNDGERRRRFSAAPRGTSPDGKFRVRYEGDRVFVTAADQDHPVELKAELESGAKYSGEIQWSPASDAFVISARVPVEARKVTIVDSSPSDQVQPKLRELDYVKPGDPLPQPGPVLFHLVDNQFVPVTIERTLFSNQFSPGGNLSFRWSADGKEFYFDYNQRGHQCYRILAVESATGTVRVVAEETSPTFIETRKKSWRHWTESGDELLWLTEADGWSHLWKIDVAGKQPPQQLTKGAWTVREVLSVDESAGTVWFMASGLRPTEDPYHLHLCRVQLDGTGFQQLTEGDGTHKVTFSPDRNQFIDTWSRADLPPVVELRNSADGSLVCEVERGDASLFTSNNGPLPERFVAKGRDGETDIYGLIYRPTNFDPAKKYPIVEHIYAGPHAAFTPKSFAEGTARQDLADLGFIVVQADGMGTNYRGKAFHDVCWKDLKDAGFPDRIGWIKAAAATRPWMDLSRVGIYGGSAGGQSAMRALLDYHDFYHVAVADCGCHDNRMDKIWWNEQWMGWPVDASYAQSSNVDDAAKLQGKLLLIVGELDTNVDPASTYQVVAALQKAGKSFDYMPIIGAGHGAAEGAYGSRLRREFLIRHLQPEGSQSSGDSQSE